MYTTQDPMPAVLIDPATDLPYAAGGSGGGGGAVTSVDLGTAADAVASTDTGTFSLIALTKRLLTLLSAAFFSAAASGATSTRITSAASTNATNLKASAGNLCQMDLSNYAAYDVFVKFYNKASAPTVGTDTPVWTIRIKAGADYSRTFPGGKSFATGIAYAFTKLVGDADATAVAAGDVSGYIDWV